MGREIKLAQLIQTIENARVSGADDVMVTGIQNDSRRIEPGNIFVATQGGQADGHGFIDDAVKKGAVAVVCERRTTKDLGDTSAQAATWIVVDDAGRALSRLASAFYGEPSDKLRILGVTGTNGKTTTAHLLRSILDGSPWGRTGIIGTVGHGTGDEIEASVHTTPEPVTLHRLFRDMADKGCAGVVMEVSSHAVRQQRTRGVDFEIGMLTNVTRDHLDYHPTFEDYVARQTRVLLHPDCEGQNKKERHVGVLKG